ncbi:uncharacterized protein YbjT (DUF2867 family) [Desulfitispora alkaliphila]|uniref:oxidoreductase n=1 Tax=Desulfitispora alkaliphila TaxID=622674 RepID=UPI003D22965B
MGSKSALIVGASGLVGNELLKQLLSAQEYGKVVALVRTSLGIDHPKLEEKIIDFDNIDFYKECFKVNDVFCCLGTTIKKAKSKEIFKKVDVDYPVAVAKLAKETQVEKFLIVSSVGANPNSKVFYSRMKGLLEEQLKELGLKSLHIFRPSLLLGERKEQRLGEDIGKFVTKGILFMFKGTLSHYSPIEARVLALGIYRIAQSNAKSGVHVYSYNQISNVTLET